MYYTFVMFIVFNILKKLFNNIFFNLIFKARYYKIFTVDNLQMISEFTNNLHIYSRK